MTKIKYILEYDQKYIYIKCENIATQDKEQKVQWHNKNQSEQGKKKQKAMRKKVTEKSIKTKDKKRNEHQIVKLRRTTKKENEST